MKLRPIIFLFGLIAVKIGKTEAQPDAEQRKVYQPQSLLQKLFSASDNQPTVDYLNNVVEVEKRFQNEKAYAETSYLASPLKIFSDIFQYTDGLFTATTSTCMENFNESDFFKTHKIEVTYSETPLSSGQRTIEYQAFSTKPQIEAHVDVCACTIPTDGSADQEAQDICVHNQINFVREYGRKNSFYVLQKGTSENVLKFAIFQTVKPYIPPPAQSTPTPPVVPIATVQAK